MADLTYESLSPALKLRVNAHILNAFGEKPNQEGDPGNQAFLDHFRRYAKNLNPSPDGNRAQTALDNLRDAVAKNAIHLKNVDAESVSSGNFPVRHALRNILDLINGELKNNRYNKASKFVEIADAGFKDIALGIGNSSNRGSDLHLNSSEFAEVKETMRHLELDLNKAERCVTLDSFICPVARVDDKNGLEGVISRYETGCLVLNGELLCPATTPTVASSPPTASRER